MDLQVATDKGAVQQCVRSGILMVKRVKTENSFFTTEVVL